MSIKFCVLGGGFGGGGGGSADFIFMGAGECSQKKSSFLKLLSSIIPVLSTQLQEIITVMRVDLGLSGCCGCSCGCNPLVGDLGAAPMLGRELSGWGGCSRGNSRDSGVFSGQLSELHSRPDSCENPILGAII